MGGYPEGVEYVDKPLHMTEGKRRTVAIREGLPCVLPDGTPFIGAGAGNRAARLHIIESTPGSGIFHVLSRCFNQGGVRDVYLENDLSYRNAKKVAGMLLQAAESITPGGVLQWPARSGRAARTTLGAVIGKAERMYHSAGLTAVRPAQGRQEGQE